MWQNNFAWFDSQRCHIQSTHWCRKCRKHDHNTKAQSHNLNKGNGMCYGNVLITVLSMRGTEQYQMSLSINLTRHAGQFFKILFCSFHFSRRCVHWHINLASLDKMIQIYFSLLQIWHIQVNISHDAVRCKYWFGSHRTHQCFVT